MPLVSVVIPIYNIEAHLEQCLDSLLWQTLTDFEIICVDDGSTDGSVEMLARYAHQDSRILVVTQENGGPGAARNTGLAHASGEYVIFLDSDDWFEPKMLELLTGSAKAMGADVTIYGADEFDTHTGRHLDGSWMLKSHLLPGGAFAPEEIADCLFQFTYGMAWDKLYVRSFLLETGILFPPLRNSEDLAFVFPTLLAARRIGVCAEVLLHHRVNRAASVSNSRSVQPNAPYEAFQLVKTYLEEHGQWGCYQRSFLNWAMEFLVWHVSNMDDPATRRDYFQTLRHTWLPALQFEAHPASYYHNRAVYAKYLLARYAPYPVFSGVVTGYKGIKGLLVRRKS